MNAERFRAQWPQFKVDIKDVWGQLTINDIAEVDGDYERFVGVLQARYGWERAEAAREVEDYFARQGG